MHPELHGNMLKTNVHYLNVLNKHEQQKHTKFLHYLSLIATSINKNIQKHTPAHSKYHSESENSLKISLVNFCCRKSWE